MWNKFKNIFTEKWLSTHIGTMAIFFSGLIFLFWFIPSLNISLIPGIEKIFGVTEIKGIISTQYMFTTLGAIFAFWYGYKKYKQDKELEFYKAFKTNEGSLSDIILDWNNQYTLRKKGYIEGYWWEIIESNYLKIVYKELNINPCESQDNEVPVMETQLKLAILLKRYTYHEEYFLKTIIPKILERINIAKKEQNYLANKGLEGKKNPIALDSIQENIITFTK